MLSCYLVLWPRSCSKLSCFKEHWSCPFFKNVCPLNVKERAEGLLYSIDWLNFIVLLSLLFEISGNTSTVIVCFSFCVVKILKFTLVSYRAVSLNDKKEWKMKYEKKDEIKSFFEKLLLKQIKTTFGRWKSDFKVIKISLWFIGTNWGSFADYVLGQKLL